jgi:hypothetical protein
LVALLIPLLGAYEVYWDEYANDFLPGSKEDERGVPNVPFTTSTNRYADATSSISPYSLTSPHFKQYRGDIYKEEVEARKDHFLELAENARLQGLALKGSGDMEREKARKALLESTEYDNSTKPNITFTVSASERWNPSLFPIQIGETYSIVVEGEQYWQDGPVLVDANGYRAYYDARSACYVALGRCRQHLKFRRRLTTSNWFSLVCAIGNFVYKLSDTIDEFSRYMPTEEEQMYETFFSVGKNTTFTSLFSGELVCFANDGDTLYHNNEGSLNVTVVRESWPPSSDFYYDQYLN